LAGGADDENEPAAAARYRRRQQPRRLIEAGDCASVGVNRPPPGGSKVRRVQERCCPERSRCIDDAPVAVDQLCVAFAAFDEATSAVAGEGGVGLAHERGEVLRAELQFAVECASEVGVEACVEEPA
jgi:hypothetical protein